MSGRERELVLINLLGRKTPVEIAAGLIVPSLHVEGAYTQTGGIIKFEVDPNGRGGYLESSLVSIPETTSRSAERGSSSTS
jgi:hypothetical protein